LEILNTPNTDYSQTPHREETAGINRLVHGQLTSRTTVAINAQREESCKMAERFKSDSTPLWLQVRDHVLRIESERAGSTEQVFVTAENFGEAVLLSTGQMQSVSCSQENLAR
jgi:hypothetical protein